jgi:hypothetical protein
MGEIKYRHDFITQSVYYIFRVLFEILFAIHLKHSSFWPSADGKPM